METVAVWGDVATWVTSIATIALFMIAFAQIRNEREARIQREKDLVEQEKRSQAEQVSGWIVKESNRVWVAVLNQSPQPVYQVIVSVVVLKQTGEKRIGDYPHQACVTVAPPGQGYIGIHADYHGMFRHVGVEIAFKDAKGRDWVRNTNGELVEMTESTIVHYGIGLPVSWQNLETFLPPDEPFG